VSQLQGTIEFSDLSVNTAFGSDTIEADGAIAVFWHNGFSAATKPYDISMLEA
jgi:hypothetical protein